MASWVINVHVRWLSKVHSRIKAELLSHDLMHADETTVQVLKEPSRKPTRKSRMWLFCSAKRDTPAYVYEYHETRGKSVAEGFLRGWKGTLTTDGYRPYFNLQEADVTNTACLVHVRRKFAEIVKVAGGDAKAGNLYTIVDAKWQDQIAEWKAIDPEIDASNCKWFYEGNTIEEACAAMAADTESGAYELDAAAVQKTVDRYNELCAKGSDDDFGKNSTFMRAIDTPPFIVVPHEFGMGLSAIIGGLLINADNQVLKADEHTPIDGLFAVGNVSGCFYGGVDYPMDVLGLSIGRAITGGYLAGKHVASL